MIDWLSMDVAPMRGIGMTLARIMRIYGDGNQVIDSESASDKALPLAMTLYIKDLEKKLDLEAGGEAEEEAGARGVGCAFMG
ncbi:MAG: hypothetical protein LBD58_02055 [Treponema sp.]|jgi:hypothetical protein|nr:hypothetical protein [Treponema sp.]